MNTFRVSAGSVNIGVILGFVALLLSISNPCLRAEEITPNDSQTVVQKTQQVQAPAKSSRANDFLGYDFEQVAMKLETSVTPLQQEMNGPLRVFSESVDDAQKLMEEGKSQEAIKKCSIAMDAVLDGRQRVLKPMWDGQDYLNGQVSKVRDRLAVAIEASGGKANVKLDQKNEKILDTVAKRITAEKDPLRKKRLVAHYKTIRQLAQIKMMADQLSPNQKKLWRNVLGVLENTTLTHQQVLMGTEVLYAQFEATANNLKEYEGLIDTVDGAARLLGVVKGLGESGQGLAQFSQNMVELQKRMSGFNGQIEGLLQDKMVDLEAQAEAVTNTLASQEEGESAFVSTEMDDELANRIKKVQQ